MSVYDWELWAKIVWPTLIILAGIGAIVGYYFIKRLVKFKVDAQGNISWFNRLWPLAVLIVGVVLVLVGIGLIIAATNANIFGTATS